MLKQRIISTLHFFDLQDYPLTLFELQRFLIADLETLKQNIDAQGEILQENFSNASESTDKILQCLETECQAEVVNTLGFYHLVARSQIAHLRLNNYFYGIKREKLIRRYVKFLQHLPFIRGVALAGSQAMGQQKQASDIDLFIITDPQFLWLGRTLATAYFQIIGKRRHGSNIANRFCLNHYLAGPKKIVQLKNLYTAYEYLKLRPLVCAHSIWQFKKANQSWLNSFFSNAQSMEPENIKQSTLQKVLEKLLSGSFGKWTEKTLKNWQLPKIRKEPFIVVEDDELSFHPDSKQKVLLERFLNNNAPLSSTINIVV